MTSEADLAEDTDADASAAWRGFDVLARELSSSRGARIGANVAWDGTLQAAAVGPQHGRPRAAAIATEHPAFGGSSSSRAPGRPSDGRAGAAATSASAPARLTAELPAAGMPSLGRPAAKFGGFDEGSVRIKNTFIHISDIEDDSENTSDASCRALRQGDAQSLSDPPPGQPSRPRGTPASAPAALAGAPSNISGSPLSPGWIPRLQLSGLYSSSSSDASSSSGWSTARSRLSTDGEASGASGDHPASSSGGERSWPSTEWEYQVYPGARLGLLPLVPAPGALQLPLQLPLQERLHTACFGAGLAGAGRCARSEASLDSLRHIPEGEESWKTGGTAAPLAALGGLPVALASMHHPGVWASPPGALDDDVDRHSITTVGFDAEGSPSAAPYLDGLRGPCPFKVQAQQKLIEASELESISVAEYGDSIFSSSFLDDGELAEDDGQSSLDDHTTVASTSSVRTRKKQTRRAGKRAKGRPCHKRSLQESEHAVVQEQAEAHQEVRALSVVEEVAPPVPPRRSLYPSRAGAMRALAVVEEKVAGCKGEAPASGTRSGDEVVEPRPQTGPVALVEQTSSECEVQPSKVGRAPLDSDDAKSKLRAPAAAPRPLAAAPAVAVAAAGTSEVDAAALLEALHFKPIATGIPSRSALFGARRSIAAGSGGCLRQASLAEDPESIVGKRVLLTGLRKITAFNGEWGKIQGYDAESQRYIVEVLLASGAPVRAKLRRDNLVIPPTLSLTFADEFHVDDMLSDEDVPLVVEPCSSKTQEPEPGGPRCTMAATAAAHELLAKVAQRRSSTSPSHRDVAGAPLVAAAAGSSIAPKTRPSTSKLTASLGATTSAKKPSNATAKTSSSSTPSAVAGHPSTREPGDGVAAARARGLRQGAAAVAAAAAARQDAAGREAAAAPANAWRPTLRPCR